MHQEVSCQLRIDTQFYARFQSILFSTTLFLSAGLLFIIQPMVAKRLLPFYGGTPAVWTICMLFFQVCVLLGYGYAWILSRLTQKYLIWIIHGGILLLAATQLPLQWQPSTLTQLAPERVIFSDLVTQIGLLTIVLASTSPLLQYLWSRTDVASARDPYPMFVASNAGCLLALLAYPFFVERYWGLANQLHYWTFAYIGYLTLVGMVFVISYRGGEKEKLIPVFELISWRRRFQWFVYSLVPCSLMLGVTFYITAEVVSTPLFWSLPLIIYLLSFILTFVNHPLLAKNQLLRVLPYFIVLQVALLFMGSVYLPVWLIVGCHLLTFGFFACMFHTVLYQLRPEVSGLTSFYWYFALGGVAAGILNGLLAPHYFTGAYEYPLMLMLAIGMLLNMLMSSKMKGMFRVVMVLICLAMMSLCYRVNLGLKDATILSQQRNFYGVKQVVDQRGTHALLSHHTVHGFEIPGIPREVLQHSAYYGPAWSVVKQLEQEYTSLNATIIGLGTGMMACQFRQTDHLTFVDVDSQVFSLASNPHYFTFIRDCGLPQGVNWIIEDGRSYMSKVSNQTLDLLVIDAFSGDAIPTHLLTQEAFSLFQKKLTKQGAILVNISNRYLNLLPVLVACGRGQEDIVLFKQDQGDTTLGQFKSTWVLLTRNDVFASQMMKQGWRFATNANTPSITWTDDYSNLLPLLT